MLAPECPHHRLKSGTVVQSMVDGGMYCQVSNQKVTAFADVLASLSVSIPERTSFIRLVLPELHSPECRPSSASDMTE